MEKLLPFNSNLMKTKRFLLLLTDLLMTLSKFQFINVSLLVCAFQEKFDLKRCQMKFFFTICLRIFIPVYHVQSSFIKIEEKLIVRDRMMRSCVCR